MFFVNKIEFSFSLACILAPELNKLIKEQRLRENSIIKLDKVVHNLTSTGKYVLVLNSCKWIIRIFNRSCLFILGLSILPQSAMAASNNNTQSNTNICPIKMITPYLNGM